MRRTSAQAARLLAAAGFVFLFSASNVFAISTFSAGAFFDIDPASVTLTGGNGYSFITETAVSNFGPTTTGTGLITTNVKVNYSAWDTHHAAAAGSAAAPGGTASLRNETHDLIHVDNFGHSTPAILEFTMTFTAASSVSTTMVGDFALANYNIHITGIGDELGESALFSTDGGATFLPIIRLKDALSFPAPIGPEFQLDVTKTAAGPGGLGSSADIGSVIVRYSVTPDNDNAFSIFARAGNFALAVATPEPATAGMLLLALPLLMRRPRRVRNKAH